MVGTGLMLELIGRDFALVEDVTLRVIVSRTAERARKAAAEFGIPESSGDFEAVLARDDIDVVYIATPHSEHFRQAMAALVAGKHVLIEKPMTPSAALTRELCTFAESRGLFAMEAMWTAFNPAIIELRARIAAGLIGDVNLVQTNFCFSVPYQPEARLWNPLLAGGSTLDQGVYTLSVPHMILGTPNRITATGTVAHDVDTETVVMLDFDSGARSLCVSSIRSDGTLSAVVAGSKGSIEINGPFWSPNGFVHRSGSAFPGMPADTVTFELEGAGYVPMIRAVSQAIADGRTEHELRNHADTIAVAETMEAVLAQIHAADAAARS
jgi:predicted dehydrogenase